MRLKLEKLKKWFDNARPALEVWLAGGLLIFAFFAVLGANPGGLVGKLNRMVFEWNKLTFFSCGDNVNLLIMSSGGDNVYFRDYDYDSADKKWKPTYENYGSTTRGVTFPYQKLTARSAYIRWNEELMLVLDRIDVSASWYFTEENSTDFQKVEPLIDRGCWAGEAGKRQFFQAAQKEWEERAPKEKVDKSKKDTDEKYLNDKRSF